MDLPLKWHGGKNYLAKRIIALMPPHTHYVEPFAGGLSVLLNKDPEGISEVVNDLNGDLSNFWGCLRDGLGFRLMQRYLDATPFSEQVWQDIPNWLLHSPGAPVDHAIAFFIHCRQSMAGRMTSFAPLSRKRTRRGMNEQVSAWLTSVEGLPEVHARLKRVAILNRPAIDVIRQQDEDSTLFYLDPPYLKETRTAKEVYQHEMTAEDHRELLDVVRECRGVVMLSGYRSDLYDSALSDWTRHEFDLANHAASGSDKRRMTECLWINRS